MWYFEVILNGSRQKHILVKARDVVEAGQKVARMLADRGYLVCEEQIIEIIRTEIGEVID